MINWRPRRQSKGMSPSATSLTLSLPSESGQLAVDAPSFEDVFRADVPFVWRVLRRLGVRDADIADVCQDVFVVVHRRLPDFDGRSAVRTWIYGICVRTASQYRRRAPQLREQPHDEVPETAVPADQESTVERRWARERLDAALARLDDDKRAVFVLYEIEELTMKDVAAALGCPLQTAYSRLHAARKEVEASFRERPEGGHGE
jgi:RNA polymerase sigma-70 factor, ECF subfamily